MRAIIGHSDDVDSEDAIREVLERCRERLGDDTPKAGLLFMSVDYDHAVVLDAIAEAWPGLPLIGATSDGEVSSDGGFRMDSVLLTLLCGDFEAYAGVGRELSANIDGAVDAALSVLPAGVEPVLALTTFAPSTDAGEVIRQFDARIPTARCPLFGGLSGDHREMARMAEFCGSEVLRDSLPILFLAGNVKASCGIGSGWIPTGPTYTVTKTDGHILQELDGNPALDVYHKYYGPVPDGHLGEYPLAVSTNGRDGPWQLRAVFGTDSETGYVRLAAGVPEGATLRMTEAVAEGVLSGTIHSIQEAIDRFAGQPEVALLFTCAARKWLLGSRAHEEIETVMRSLPAVAGADLGLAGLYVFGEIAPAAEREASSLHNETCVTVLLGAA